MSMRTALTQMRSPRRNAMAAILVLALIVMVNLPTSATLTKATVSSVTWSPGKPSPGDYTTFSFTVQNTYTSDLSVKWFGVHFDWMASKVYVFEDMAATPVVIHPGDSWTFFLTTTIPVNTTLAAHSYYVKMDYSSGTYSYSETSDNFSDLIVSKYVAPTLKPFWQDPLILIAVLLVVVMVIVIVVFLVIRKRRLDLEAARKHQGIQSAVAPQSQDYDGELARTVTKQTTGPVRVDSHRPRHWEAPTQEQRYAGQPPKPPIYKILGQEKDQQQPVQQPVTMPQAPPPQVPPPSTGQTPQHMPDRPPPKMMPQAPPPKPVQQGPSGLPPPLPPPREQATLHQCPICGKMNKATDTTCPKCGNKL